MVRALAFHIRLKISSESPQKPLRMPVSIETFLCSSSTKLVNNDAVLTAKGSLFQYIIDLHLNWSW